MKTEIWRACQILKMTIVEVFRNTYQQSNQNVQKKFLNSLALRKATLDQIVHLYRCLKVNAEECNAHYQGEGGGYNIIQGYRKKICFKSAILDFPGRDLHQTASVMTAASPSPSCKLSLVSLLSERDILTNRQCAKSNRERNICE